MASKNQFKLVAKLQSIDSPTDAVAALKEMRKLKVFSKLPYDDILSACLHTEVIVSRLDPKFPVFNEELRELLDGKSDDEQILLLSEMILMF